MSQNLYKLHVCLAFNLLTFLHVVSARKICYRLIKLTKNCVEIGHLKMLSKAFNFFLKASRTDGNLFRQQYILENWNVNF